MLVQFDLYLLAIKVARNQELPRTRTVQQTYHTFGLIGRVMSIRGARYVDVCSFLNLFVNTPVRRGKNNPEKGSTGGSTGMCAE